MVMPYGLYGAPSLFQCLKNDVLKDMLGKFVIAYIDNILTYSPSCESHVSHLKQVLSCLLANEIYLKGENCEFHVSSVTFLGYIISPEGVDMVPSKVSAVIVWPILQSVMDLQCFLGFANFYWHFICGFSTAAMSLTSLLSLSQERSQEAHVEPNSRSHIPCPHDCFHFCAHPETLLTQLNLS